MAATKADYIEALTKAGVALNGDEKLDALKELAQANAVVLDAKPEATATKAVVMAEAGGHIRTYDVDTHGEDFHDLAKEFVAHTPGATIVLS
jgi:hypothetical protein